MHESRFLKTFLWREIRFDVTSQHYLHVLSDSIFVNNISIYMMNLWRMREDWRLIKFQVIYLFIWLSYYNFWIYHFILCPTSLFKFRSLNQIPLRSPPLPDSSSYFLIIEKKYIYIVMGESDARRFCSWNYWGGRKPEADEAEGLTSFPGKAWGEGEAAGAIAGPAAPPAIINHVSINTALHTSHATIIIIIINSDPYTLIVEYFSIFGCRS